MKSDFFLDRMLTLFRNQRLVQSIIVSCDSNASRFNMALQLSKSLSCSTPDNSGNACQNCTACQKIQHSNHPDIYNYTPEKNEIPLDDVKKMLKWLSISPYEQKHKILHIHNAHKLNASSSNALLKTLEEPPSYAHIFLWSENQNRLLRTLLSRSLKCHIHEIQGLDHVVKETPAWSSELHEILEHKNHVALDHIFSFSKSLAKSKDEHPFFFETLYDTFLKHYQRDLDKKTSLHLNRMEDFHDLLHLAQTQVLNRYGNAQLWIERILIDWKRLWNLA